MSGFGYFFRGLHLLVQPGIRAFVILPVVVNLILFALLTWFMVAQIDTLTTWLVSSLGEWMQWLLWIIWLAAGALWLFIYGFSFALISNAIAAPFYGLLAEQIQALHAVENKPPPLTFRSFIALTKRAMIREWQKLLYIISRLLLIVLISLPLYFIPLVGLFVPVIWFFWAAWSLALQNLDYVADNNQVGFVALRTQLKQQRTLSLSFGATTVMASSIPLFNLIAVPAAVAGGTLLWLEKISPPAEKI